MSAPPVADGRLDRAVHGLAWRAPEFSAFSGLWPRQKVALAIFSAGLAAGCFLVPDGTIPFLFALMAIPFLFVVLIRVVALAHALVGRPPAKLKWRRARSDAGWPVYTILVPLYREEAAVPNLIASLLALDYPCDRLEVLLLTEAADMATRRALERQNLPAHMRVVVVPEGAPRTKPRALQFAMTGARGDFIVVYDAEDCPEPDQLKRALLAFAAGGRRLGCVQARLTIHNDRSSFLARQFAIEYAALFGCLLPALQWLSAPMPLGGTSNHFPRHVLEAVGGWDPFNVTEDADLGIRLARAGWRIGVISSATQEEAPEEFRVWLGQRTRWLKGWMQTYIVHTRHPMRLWRDLGTRRFCAFHVVMGGFVLSALVHPWFYVIAAVEAVDGSILLPAANWPKRWLCWLAVFNLFAGYTSAVALGMVAVVRERRFALLPSCLLMPVYWLAISLAAYRAIWQLLAAPHYWEKTAHKGMRPPGQTAPRRRSPPWAERIPFERPPERVLRPLALQPPRDLPPLPLFPPPPTRPPGRGWNGPRRPMG